MDTTIVIVGKGPRCKELSTHIAAQWSTLVSMDDRSTLTEVLHVKPYAPIQELFESYSTETANMDKDEKDAETDAILDRFGGNDSSGVLLNYTMNKIKESSSTLESMGCVTLNIVEVDRINIRTIRLLQGVPSAMQILLTSPDAEWEEEELDPAVVSIDTSEKGWLSKSVLLVTNVIFKNKF